MRRRNNKGFSLIELIVTVTILAIIVAPLLRAFVISAQTNAKAKERLRATDLAQNILENMEASGLSELSRQVNSGSYRLLVDATGTTADGSCELHRESASASTFSVATTTDSVSAFDWVATVEANASSVLDTATNTYEFRGTQNADSCYYFAIGGIVSDGVKYDALITASPAAAGTNDKDVNQANLAQISAISSDTSHVVTYTYANAISDRSQISYQNDGKVKDASGNTCGAYDTYMNHIKRTVTVELEGDTEISGVTVTYSYDLQDSYKTDRDLTNLFTRTETAFDNGGDASVQMEKLYLMLYPWYNGNSANADTIRIVNPNNFSCDIIVAQQTKDPDDSRTEAQNAFYAMNIAVVEKAESDGSMSAHTHATVRTQTESGIRVTWNRYQYQDGGNPIFIGTDSTAMSDELVETKREGRNFDVTIRIYPAGVLFHGTDYVTSFRIDEEEAYSTFTGGLVY